MLIPNEVQHTLKFVQENSNSIIKMQWPEIKNAKFSKQQHGSIKYQNRIIQQKNN